MSVKGEQGGLVARDSGRRCQRESKNCSGTGESQEIQTKLLMLRTK